MLGNEGIWTIFRSEIRLKMIRSLAKGKDKERKECIKVYYQVHIKPRKLLEMFHFEIARILAPR